MAVRHVPGTASVWIRYQRCSQTKARSRSSRSSIAVRLANFSIQTLPGHAGSPPEYTFQVHTERTRGRASRTWWRRAGNASASWSLTLSGFTLPMATQYVLLDGSLSISHDDVQDHGHAAQGGELVSPSPPTHPLTRDHRRGPALIRALSRFLRAWVSGRCSPPHTVRDSRRRRPCNSSSRSHRGPAPDLRPRSRPHPQDHEAERVPYCAGVPAGPRSPGAARDRPHAWVVPLASMVPVRACHRLWPLHRSLDGFPVVRAPSFPPPSLSSASSY